MCCSNMSVSNFQNNNNNNNNNNVYLLTPNMQIFRTYNFDADIIRCYAKRPCNRGEGGILIVRVFVCVSFKCSNIGELK
jgi:hypothetical protein